MARPRRGIPTEAGTAVAAVTDWFWLHNIIVLLFFFLFGFFKRREKKANNFHSCVWKLELPANSVFPVFGHRVALKKKWTDGGISGSRFWCCIMEICVSCVFLLQEQYAVWAFTHSFFSQLVGSISEFLTLSPLLGLLVVSSQEKAKVIHHCSQPHPAL